MSDQVKPDVAAAAEEGGPADAGPASQDLGPAPEAAATRHAGHSGQGSRGGRASEEPGGYDEYDAPRREAGAGEIHPDTKRAQEHLSDLKRLQAEYVNYKKRVDRDRAVARDLGVAQVVEALIPVLDDIHLAREHGDLDDGPFPAIADKLEGVLGRFGVTRLGEKGEPFDPAVHEALMHVDAQLHEDATTTTVVQVLQPGYRVGERVVRPARVSVADPPAPTGSREEKPTVADQDEGGDAQPGDPQPGDPQPGDPQAGDPQPGDPQ